MALERWLDRPAATTSRARGPSAASASPAAARTEATMASPSCSAQSACGWEMVTAFEPLAQAWPRWSKTRARLACVPWSMASTKGSGVAPRVRVMA